MFSFSIALDFSPTTTFLFSLILTIPTFRKSPFTPLTDLYPLPSLTLSFASNDPTFLLSIQQELLELD